MYGSSSGSTSEHHLASSSCGGQTQLTVRIDGTLDTRGREVAGASLLLLLATANLRLSFSRSKATSRAWSSRIHRPHTDSRERLLTHAEEWGGPIEVLQWSACARPRSTFPSTSPHHDLGRFEAAQVHVLKGCLSFASNVSSRDRLFTIEDAGSERQTSTLHVERVGGQMTTALPDRACRILLQDNCSVPIGKNALFHHRRIASHSLRVAGLVPVRELVTARSRRASWSAARGRRSRRVGGGCGFASAASIAGA